MNFLWHEKVKTFQLNLKTCFLTIFLKPYFYHSWHGSFRFVCNRRNDCSNFFQTWLPHAFSITNWEYIAYFILFYPYIYIRSIIWIIWSIPLLFIIYSKSHLSTLSKKFRNNFSWLTVIFPKEHFWNDLGKLSVWFHMIQYDV